MLQNKWWEYKITHRQYEQYSLYDSFETEAERKAYLVGYKEGEKDGYDEGKYDCQ